MPPEAKSSSPIRRALFMLFVLVKAENTESLTQEILTRLAPRDVAH
jgi:hypothetical protein